MSGNYEAEASTHKSSTENLLIKSILTSVVLMLLFQVCFSQQDESRENYKKGSEALQAKKYNKAISLLSLSIEKNPTANGYFNRAVAYYHTGDTCHFCMDLKKAIELNDTEARRLHKEKCRYSIFRPNVPDSVKYKIPEADQLEIEHEKCGTDTTIYVIINSKNNSERLNFNLLFNDTVVFMFADNIPEFPGGDKARFNFISKNIQYPQDAILNNLQGSVYVSFIVEKDGSISEIKILKGIGGSCDEEAIRLVKSMPKWMPAKQDGTPVRFLYNLPIHFSLTDKN